MWVVTRHQYGISAPDPQTSLSGETSGDVEKCQLFYQANTYSIYTAIFVRPLKMVSVSVCYLFYQPMNAKIKTWTLRFPAKENPYTEKALFVCQSCCSMT